MFNKLKKVFGYRDNQHTISVREMNTKGLDISEPIYTIVKKVKENPKRLQIKRTCANYGEKYFIVDTITGTEAIFYYTTTVTLLIAGLTLTEDEEKYILQKLWSTYQRREKRYGELIHLRKQRERDKREKINRDKMLKLLEEE